MATDKIWRSIHNIIRSSPPNIFQYNKQTKYLALKKNCWRWVSVYCTFTAPLVFALVASLLLDLFVDKSVPSHVKHFIAIVLMLSFGLAGLAAVFSHTFLLNGGYLILLFNCVAKFEPKFGKQITLGVIIPFN